MIKKQLLTLVICIGAVVIFAQDTLTIGQVYNYNIGDEMHYKTTNSFGFYESGNRKIVLDKWMSQDNDTVFYIIHNNNYVQQYDPSSGSGITDYNVYDDTTYVTNLNDKITLLSKWDNIDIEAPNIFNFQYEYGNNSEYGDILTNGYSYGIGDLEPTYVGDIWAAGLGMVREYYAEMDEDNYITTEMSLVYYKKGTNEWGNSINLGIEDTASAPAINCIPNPATTYITINNTHAGQLSIYALNGQLLKQIAISPTQRVDIADFPAGIYMLKWQGADNQQTHSIKWIKL